MLRSYRLFSIRGTPVRVDLSLIVLLGFAFALAGPEGGWFGWLRTTGVLAIVVLCLFLHEVGHAVAAWRLGIPVQSITMHAFGGLANVGPAILSPAQELRIAAAGPLVNSVLTAAFGLVWLVFPRVAPWVALPLVFNAGLAVLNLVPGFVPGFATDGGRILRCVLERRQSPARAALVTAEVARWVAITVLAVALFAAESWILAGFAGVLIVGATVERTRARLLMRTERIVEAAAQRAPR